MKKMKIPIKLFGNKTFLTPTYWELPHYLIYEATIHDPDFLFFGLVLINKKTNKKIFLRAAHTKKLFNILKKIDSFEDFIANLDPEELIYATEHFN